MTDGTDPETSVRRLPIGLLVSVMAVCILTSVSAIVLCVVSEGYAEGDSGEQVPDLMSWSSGEIRVTKVRIGGDLISESFVLPTNVCIEDLTVFEGSEPISVRSLDSDWIITHISQGYLIDSNWLIDGSGTVYVPIEVDYFTSGYSNESLIVTVTWIIEVVVVLEFKAVKEVILA